METRKAHIVPRFYLENFADHKQQLWTCDLKDRRIFKSNPRDAATYRDFYRGDQARHEDDLERKLSTIESDAAPHLKRFLHGSLEIGDELLRFIAWMAARTMWLKRLFAQFDFKEYLKENFEELCNVECDPKGRALPFDFCSKGQIRQLQISQSKPYLEDPNWTIEMSQDQFLDMVRLQAYCFRTMHFPLLKWFSVQAPPGRRFITSDRPVSWDVLSNGWTDLPSVLKHPLVDLILPLSPEVLMMAGHDQASMNALQVTPDELNSRIAQRAERFLFARSEEDFERINIRTWQ